MSIQEILFYVVLSIPGVFILYRLYLKFKFYGANFDMIKQTSTMVVIILFILVYTALIIGFGKLLGFMLK